jgi:Na+/melibiose symporter-like transporter
MFNTAINFERYPSNVKKAIVCLTLGWIVHLVFYFKFLPGDVPARSDYLMVAVGIASCFFVASINTWARMLSLFGNIIILITYLYLAMLVFQKPAFVLQAMTTTVLILFVLATYYLVRKDTAEFFRSFNAAKAQREEKKE